MGHSTGLGLSACGPLRTLAVFAAVGASRARLRAGRPGRSGVGALACGEGALRCSPGQGGCGTRPFARCAGNGARQSSPSRRCAAGNPDQAALLGADNSRPDLPTRSLAGSGHLSSTRRRKQRMLRPEGGVPPGRIGAGEQRSAARGSPVYPPGRREAMRWAPRPAVPTVASQPPSRSEQRSAPSPQARAAPSKPRRDTALGPAPRQRKAVGRNVRNGPQAENPIGHSVCRPMSASGRFIARSAVRWWPPFRHRRLPPARRAPRCHRGWRGARAPAPGRNACRRS